MKSNQFQKWLETEDGKSCADYITLRPGEYLKNRLWYAFEAGSLAGCKKSESTIDWYEQKLREMKAKIALLEKDHKSEQPESEQP